MLVTYKSMPATDATLGLDVCAECNGWVAVGESDLAKTSFKNPSPRADTALDDRWWSLDAAGWCAAGVGTGEP